MTRTDQQFPQEVQTSRATLGLVGAILLIVLGIVLQLDIFGYGHFNADGYWFISVIADAVWSIVATKLDMPFLNVLIRLWPLIIVSSGLMILSTFRPTRLARARSAAQAKGQNDA